MLAARRFVVALLAPASALAVLLAACGDDGGTDPGPMRLADPLATAAKIQALQGSFGTAAFQSFSLASTYTPAAGSLVRLGAILGAAAPTLDAGRALSAPQGRLAAAALAAALGSRSGLQAAPILPPEVRGKTLEWDEAMFRYVITERAGAPGNGVRFILYALDGVTPIVAQEIGYADFLDEDPGSTTRAQLHVRVIGTIPEPDITYLDYTINVTVTASSASVTVLGYITDGSQRLDFNATGSEDASSATFDVRLDVNAQDAHVRLKVTATAPSSSTLRLGVDLRLQFGGEVVTLTGTETVDFNTFEVTGAHTVRVNGGIYATITISDSGQPSYASGSSQALTADDITALNAVYTAGGAALTRFGELLAPAGLVVLE